MAAFAAAAAKLQPVDSAAWAASVKQARAEYLENIEIRPTVGALDMAHVTHVLREKLPKDAVLANDAGNFSGWAHRYLQFSRYPSQVGPTSGAMGYGVPAALGACVAAPDRLVVCFVGDGGFLMSGAEIATAIHHELKPLILVVNNGMYGTIRMHQEREHPGRYPGTALTNPDFAAFARSFGAFGEVVTRNDEFEGALERAVKAGKCALLELRTDPEAITTRTTLTAVRNAALARRKA
jgi:acetolactate synthase-1/2/3 large subunit